MSLLHRPHTKLAAATLCAISIAGCGQQDIVGTKNGNEGIPPTHNDKNIEAMGSIDTVLRGELDCLWVESTGGGKATILVMPADSGYTTRLDDDSVVLVKDGDDVAKEGDKISFGGAPSDLPDDFAESSSTCANLGIEFIGFVNTGTVIRDE